MKIMKTDWKSVVQPRVLSATAVMVWTAGGEVERMRRWTEIGGARMHASSGAAGRDWSTNCQGEGYENRDHICAVHV